MQPMIRQAILGAFTRNRSAVQLAGVLAVFFVMIASTLMPQSSLSVLAKAGRRIQPEDGNNCQLTVPANPLSAEGLATPWMLQAGCSMTNPNQQVFVQAVIFDPAAKKLEAYMPLVVDAGMAPAVTPTAPTLPANAVVGIFGGGNDDATTLIGDGAASCVNGADGKIFGQVFFCGTEALFAAVNKAHIHIPALGQSLDGRGCPSVRSFRIVDQDQSDNVQTTYLLTASGQTMQNTAANRAQFPDAAIINNGSDNSLLEVTDKALGCQPWLIPDIGDGGNLVATQATDELQAARYQGTQALIPAGDPMVGPNDLLMLNAYRVSVDQPPVRGLGNASTIDYCNNLLRIAPEWIEGDEALFMNAPSLAAGVNNFDFLQQRLNTTVQLLGCTLPVHQRGNGDNDHHNHDRAGAVKHVAAQ